MRTAVYAYMMMVCLWGCSGFAERLEEEGLIVLEGATLIDGSGKEERSHSIVVIRGTHIFRVGDMGQYAFPPDAKIIDVRGRWIIPGFIDTHAHMPDTGNQREVLRVLLSFGITSARVAAADPSNGVELRDRVARGEILGPRLETAGRLIDAPGGIFSGWAAEVKSIDEIRTEIKRQAEEGVDFIKLYRGLRPELVEAAIKEAHSLGLRVLGHLGSTTLGQAAQFGIDGLAHFGIFATPWELAPEKDQQVIRQSCDSCESDGDEAGLRALRSTVQPFGPNAVKWARHLAGYGVTVEPNLVLLHSVFWGNDAAVLKALSPEYAPANWRDGKWFDAVPHPYLGPCTAKWEREAKATYPFFERLVALLDSVGVILSVGTDLMNPWMTPGVSYHQELELLVNAGLSTREVLVCATRNGSIALGLEGEIGTIEQGKTADLVILSSDPTVDIRNTRDIQRVFLHGRELNPRVLVSGR